MTDTRESLRAHPQVETGDPTWSTRRPTPDYESESHLPGEVGPTPTSPPRGERRHDARVTAGVISGGALAESVGGIGAIVLAILGLAGILPFYMIAVATLAVGASMCLEGGAIAARWRALVSRMDSRGELIGAGTSAELVCGAGGIVLGILALVGILPMVLLPVAAIAFGGALLVSSGTASRLTQFRSGSGPRSTSENRMAEESLAAAAGLQVLVGLGGVVLGILALLADGQAGWQALTLVALLAYGAAILLTGTTLTAKLMNVMPR